MPIPWFCGVCGKRAFNKQEMCEHLREEYMDAYFEEHTPKSAVNADRNDNTDLLVGEHIVYSNKGSLK